MENKTVIIYKLENHKKVVINLIAKREELLKNKLGYLYYNQYFIGIYNQYFKYIIQNCIYRYAKHKLYEDIQQVAMIGLLKAIDDIHELRSNNFNKFAKGYIRNEIKALLYNDNNNINFKHIKKSTTRFLIDQSIHKDQLEEYIMAQEKELFNRTFARLLAYLPENKKQILDLYLSEVPIYKIAKKLDISVRKVEKELKLIENTFGEFCINYFNQESSESWIKLTDIQTKIIKLFVTDEKTLGQISKELNISILEVAKQYSLAFAKLSGRL